MIHCLDFQSMYPCMMIGGNLFSHTKIKPPQSWQGGGIYASIYQNDIDGVVGTYLKDPGNIERVVSSWMSTRLELKNAIKTTEVGSPEYIQYKRRILAQKICVNTIYGLSGAPMFKSIYNRTSASDCTAMARRTIKHTKTIFNELGYDVLYGDTDSVFVNDPTGNTARIEQIASEITKIQRKSMNVDCPFHKLELEKSIKHMWFFKKDDGMYAKKNYIYVDINDELTIKGLPVVRGDCSNLAKTYWDEILKPRFINNSFTWLKPEVLLIELKHIVKTRPHLLEKRYRVNSPDTYKVPDGKEESSALNYTIAKKFGLGEHWLIANKKIGPGKGKKYATMDMLKEKYGDSWVDSVLYEPYMSELSKFILPEYRKNIHKTDRARI